MDQWSLSVFIFRFPTAIHSFTNNHLFVSVSEHKGELDIILAPIEHIFFL